MQATIAGLLIATAGLYVWYYCHRLFVLNWAAKRILIHCAGIVAMLLPAAFFGRALAIGVGGPVWRMDDKYDLILKEMRATIAQFPRGAKKRAAKP